MILICISPMSAAFPATDPHLISAESLVSRILMSHQNVTVRNWVIGLHLDPVNRVKANAYSLTQSSILVTFLGLFVVCTFSHLV